MKAVKAVYYLFITLCCVVCALIARCHCKVCVCLLPYSYVIYNVTKSDLSVFEEDRKVQGFGISYHKKCVTLTPETTVHITSHASGKHQDDQDDILWVQPSATPQMSSRGN